jgi:uridylate kinase
MNQDLKYQRVVLKLSGEAMGRHEGYPIDPLEAEKVAKKICAVHDLGVEVAVVIGGGNLWRGTAGIARGMERATSDYMGMLGTVINALALMDAIERSGVTVRVQTAIEMRAVAEPYIRRRAVRHLEKGRIVIFAGGTGNPYFSTDTAAVLRAMEIDADLVIKGTKVDGIYDKDPRKHTDAVKYSDLTFMQAISDRLEVVDSTALTMCMDNDMPLLVLDLWHDDELPRAILGEKVGTLVHN